MRKLIDFKTTQGSLPACHIRSVYPESRGMIAAILDGYFTVTDSDDYAVLIVDDGEFLHVSSAGGKQSETISSPFTSEQLLQAVFSVGDGQKNPDFTADRKELLAIRGELSVRLTETEFRLYSAILENGGNYVSAEDLSLAVWGEVNRNLCTVYISYLRKKLDGAFGEGTLITASKKGYKLLSDK